MARNGKRNTRLIVFGIVLMLVVVLALQPLSIFSGFDTISLSTVSFTSNDPDLDGEVFVLTVVQDGTRDFASGTYSPSEMNSYLSGDAQTSQELKIDLELEEKSCEYSITSENAAIKRLSIVEEGKCVFCNDERLSCEANDGTFFGKSEVFERDYMCVKEVPIATIGRLERTGFVFKDKIKVWAGEEYDEAYIGSQEATSVSLMDGLVRARWAGNLESGVDCPTATEEGVRAAYASSWRIINENKYQNYIIYTADWDDCFNDIIVPLGANYDIEDLQACVNEYNSYSNVAYEEDDFSGGVVSGTVSSGAVKVEVDELLQRPVIIMKVKADTLGIVSPVGIPKIVDAASPKFHVGTKGNIYVDVKNVGSADAGFDVLVTCPAPFSVLGVSQPVNVDSGETERVDFKVTTGTQGVANCDIVASDANKAENRDTSTVRVEADELTFCVDNEGRCTSSNVWEVCSAGVWEPTADDRCINPVEDNNLLLIVIIVAATLVVIMIMVVAKATGSKKGKKKKR